MSRRQDLSLVQKINLLDLIKDKKETTSVRRLSIMLNIARTSIARLIKQEDELRKAWESRDWQQGTNKRNRHGKEPDVEKALKHWYSLEIHENANINNALLKRKAEEFADKLGKTGFQFSDGWLSRWKSRYQIKLLGESGGTVDEEPGEESSSRPVRRRGKRIKAEPVEEASANYEHETEPEEEPKTEPGRRPSRRAAREAAKKIYNTVRNFNGLPEIDTPAVVVPKPPVVARTPPKKKPLVKVPPPDIDLHMECHEELLSSIQAEAMLQAQLQYNMVMKTLRNLKANNVRIICMSADEAEQPSQADGSIVPDCNTKPNRQPNIVTLQVVKKEEPSVYPMELSESKETVLSPCAPILS